MIFFNDNKRTNFLAGGLRPPRRLKVAENTLVTDPRFVAPRRIDHRDYCIQTSNQSQTPECAAYSTAGFIEVKNWMKNHYPEQVNPDPIYNEAKKLDDDNSPGTSLDNACQAAFNLKLITGSLNFVEDDINSIKFAIHTNLVMIGGLMITDEWNYVNTKTGLIPNYEDKAKQIGGHGILICGYDDNGIYIQNSWGSNWGLYGFAILSWAQVEKQFSYGVVIIP